MGRPNQMTDQNNNILVSGLQYGPSNETDSITYFGATEARQYNEMLELTQLTVTNGGSTVLNMQYGYPQPVQSVNTDTGKIISQNDLANGEQVQYAYDSLSRLTCAYGGASVAAITSCSTVPSGAVWGQGYSYDGFGNLGAKTVLYGSVPTMSVGIDATTNRIVGQSYDANGNMLTHPTAGSVTYDAENHIATAGGASYKYGYDSTGKRIWASTPSGEQYFFYGPSGRRLGSYTLTVNATTITFTPSATRAYFAGRLVSQDGTHPMIEDRTHSMRVDGAGNKGGFYPYGEDKGTPFTNDQVKFGTYTRDGGTLLDYADQRSYASNYGRFLTADPYDGSAQPNDPQTWNRYEYVQGDPVNDSDPDGLDSIPDPTTDPLGYSQYISQMMYGGGSGDPIGTCLVDGEPMDCGLAQSLSPSALQQSCGCPGSSYDQTCTCPQPFPLPPFSLPNPGPYVVGWTISVTFPVLRLAGAIMRHTGWTATPRGVESRSNTNVKDSGIVKELTENYRNVDPCTALQDMLDKAQEEGDTEKVQRIQTTQKGYGCRRTHPRNR